MIEDRIHIAGSPGNSFADFKTSVLEAVIMHDELVRKASERTKSNVSRIKKLIKELVANKEILDYASREPGVGSDKRYALEEIVDSLERLYSGKPPAKGSLVEMYMVAEEELRKASHVMSKAMNRLDR